MDKKFLRNITFYLLTISGIVISAFYILDHVRFLKLGDIDTVLCIFICICFLAILLINIKNVEWNPSYILFALFLIYCISRTYDTNPEIFKTYAGHLFAASSMALMFTIPFKKGNNEKRSALEKIEIAMIVFTIVCDIAGILYSPGRPFKRGIISNQNYLGGFNSACLCVLGNFFFRKKDKKVKVVCLILFVLMLAFIYMNTSRYALLGACAYMGLLYLFSIKDLYKKNKLLAVLPLILGVLILILFWDKLFYYFTNSTDFSASRFYQKLMNGRDEIWFVIFPRLMKDCLIFGKGPMTFAQECFNNHLFIYPDQYGTAGAFGHNFIVDTIYNGGLVGTVLILTSFICFIRFIRKKNIQNRFSKRLAIVTITATLISILFENLFIFAFYYSNLVIFLEMGMLTCMEEDNEKD